MESETTTQPGVDYREPAVVARLRAVFAAGADDETLRAALRAVRDERENMTPYEWAMSGELTGEVAKYLLFGGRA
ncbi:hypothetical protein V3W47_11095 [Deinococcus sp. YIM 134068]|uniref:hypothetical protein n=1 Tax=Deinococcus lichenicola TaxID=3118910 RepID=UPI002F9218A7